ncbi:PAS domain S-box-containing protein/diguanylate cyclase (GGDEF)-like protein [Actinocorallia herbida]|uniref:PAS domain S-box-containing protein/diguanylate cyclase (GGDEF)-like protein n=1 Tax=Actinocorallia herbida TaxID=58109 RepID=A0A3N1CQ63_9ACTN|nr:GGDEF domain-containing phosphodiesterase [Actinocorallia herbida]ROO83304.1 PAS domain S-box-containing protein/diguanylate cyclase (GGDEF)-like protein [Actinocorallia herbida]
MTGEESPRRLPAQALPLTIVVAFGALYAIGALLGWTSDWFAAGAGAAACGSLLYAAWHKPGDTGSWRWFGAAAGLWGVSGVVRAVSRLVLPGQVMSLSLADLFGVAAIVAFAAGFIVPTRLPRSPRQWLRYGADSYVCGVALFVLGWDAIFGNLFRLSGEAPVQFLLELVFPLLDIVLVCALLPFVLGAARRQRPTAVIAYLALLALTAGDVVNTAVRLESGTSVIGDVFRFGGLLLLGAAPWIGTGSRRGGVRGRMVGPGIAPALLAGAAAMFVAGHTLTGSRPVEPVVLIVAGTALLVLIARLTDLLRENDRLKSEIRAGEEHFRALAESVEDLVLICDEPGTVQYVNAGQQWNTGHALPDLLGRPLTELLHSEDVAEVVAALNRCDEGAREPLRLACRLRTEDGTWLPTESTFSRYAPGRVLITVRDLSEEAALKRQVDHLTFHDGLTGLPNRAYLEERTRQVLARRSPVSAVIFVDLDGFTAVNDSAGHAAGDQVLAQAARRLRAAVPADDTVARWGGDEFAVLVETASDAQSVVDLAERLLRVLSAEPYRVGERGIALTAGVGVAFADDDLASTTEAHSLDETGSASLIRNGDLAMTRAKELGGGRVEVFATQMHAAVVRRMELSSDLQRALAEEEFEVVFQPVFDLADGRVTGVEALARWRRDGDLVPPQDFLDAAEESGLIVPLGAWILREACGRAARWRAEGWEIGLSVNFTARQIAAPKFAATVAAALTETGLPPHALTLEVKEEVLVEQIQGGEQNDERLAVLRELGVRLAIDDFGTGYASLAFLGQLPVDVIKIDPSFTAGLDGDETRTLLTRTIISLGSDLGLTVVAEGIESAAQQEALRGMGCHRGQGFHLARPMSAARIDAEIRPGVVPLPGVQAG